MVADVTQNTVTVGVGVGQTVLTTVSTSSSVNITDKHGNLLGTTTTTTTAYFGTKGDSAGNYLGTGIETSTVPTVLGAVTGVEASQSSTFTRDLKGAIATFGGANVVQAQSMAASYSFSIPPMAAKEKWSTTGKVAAGALMFACFVGEPCGAFEAGASLVVGAAALGETVSH